MTVYATHATWLIDGNDPEPICVIEDISGGLGAPTLRGDPLAIPYKSGRTFVTQTADSKKLTLGLAITDVDPATGNPGTDPIAQFLANWQTVRGWFLPIDSSDSNQIKVTRPIAITQKLTLPSGLQTTTGHAVVTPDSLFPTVPGPSVARAVVELLVIDGALLYT